MLSDSKNAPSNLSVTARSTDRNSQVVWEEDVPVSDWVEGSEGWVGRVAFDGPSGLSSYAFVRKGGSDKPLQTFSYTSP
jgi:hypothetical protein